MKPIKKKVSQVENLTINTVTTPTLEWNKYSSEELDAAWNKISPQRHGLHWKEEIGAVIKQEDFEVCSAACIHYTATELRVVDDWKELGLIVQAAGYWQGPAN